MRESVSRQHVNELVERASAGDRGALDELVEVLYQELRSIAHERRARWRGAETLSTTVLVNEAYMRLARLDHATWEDSVHFKAVAATAMRQILVDYSRRRGAKKRGGEWERLTIDRVAGLFPALADPSSVSTEALLQLNDSLLKLERENPDYTRIVECRFFGGMTIEETGEALDISPATVKRRWRLARAWLHREIDPT
jgi:RNA polymerase sigma factor (TIGR02999 family)